MADDAVVYTQDVVTRDADQAHQFLVEAYAKNRMTVHRATPEGASFAASVRGVGEVALSKIGFGFDVSIDTDLLDHVGVGVLLGGTYAVAARGFGESDRLGAGDVWMPAGDTQCNSELTRVSMLYLVLPREVLNRAASDLADRTDGEAGEVGFQSMRPISPELGRHWRETLTYVGRQLSTDNPALAAPLVQASITAHLAASILTVFPHTTSVDTRPRAGHVASATLRRAVEHIEAHAHEPISLSDIAAAAHITPRALQMAFRRSFDLTPMAYVREVRVQRAHRDLLTADPSSGASVAAIAARWGFAKPDRFAAHYRTRYGVAPSQTLRS